MGVIIWGVLYATNSVDTVVRSIVGGMIAGPVICRLMVTDWSIVSTVFMFSSLLIIEYNNSVLNVIGETRAFKLFGAISFDVYLWNCPIFVLF